MSVLELQNVSRTYGQGAAEVRALDNVSLLVDAGTMVAVMGPSGSGKSTLLMIAGSLEDPTSGEVLVGGVALSGMSRGAKARLRRRTIGYVFQDFNLLPGLTAAENVALPLGARWRAGAAGPGRRGAGPGRARSPGPSRLGDRQHRARTELAVILVGLPLAAVIGGWLFAGRQPSAIARQPLE